MRAKSLCRQRRLRVEREIPRALTLVLSSRAAAYGEQAWSRRSIPGVRERREIACDLRVRRRIRREDERAIIRVAVAIDVSADNRCEWHAGHDVPWARDREPTDGV